MTNEFIFFTDGKLHGDHSDNTGEYQRQLENLEAQIGPVGTIPGTVAHVTPVIDMPGRTDLTGLEVVELHALRPQFEPAGVFGDYHADHSDTSNQYNDDFVRYCELIGIPVPPFMQQRCQTSIGDDGGINDLALRQKLAQIIAEERENLIP